VSHPQHNELYEPVRLY